MEKVQETRIEWSEEKKRRIATGQRQHQQILANMKSLLMSRNALSGKPLPEPFIDLQIQSYVAISDIAAMVDTLESMGRIDRVEYTAKSVDRLARMFQVLEQPN